jgi:hypothetical protein
MPLMARELGGISDLAVPREGSLLKRGPTLASA